MHREVRRKERAMTESDAWELLRRGEYGILSTTGADGSPYGVPLNYFETAGVLYVHCAVEGRKLENLAAEPRVSFCVVGKTEIPQDRFTVKYESVIVEGRAEEVVAQEKQMALEGLLVRYFSERSEEERLQYIEAMGGRTKVFRIGIDDIKGKRN